MIHVFCKLYLMMSQVQDFTKQDVEIIDQKVLHSGFFHMKGLQLRYKLFQGGWGEVLHRELFASGHVAALLPYDPQRDTVVLVEQFRIGALEDSRSPWLIELVAGMMDGHEGESPEALARREAMEEAGCSIQNIEPIFEYWVSPGTSSEKVHLFCGQTDSTGLGEFAGLAAEHEDIRVHTVPFTEALSWLTTGKINNAATLIAMQWLAANRQSLKNKWLQEDK